MGIRFFYFAMLVNRHVDQMHHASVQLKNDPFQSKYSPFHVPIWFQSLKEIVWTSSLSTVGWFDWQQTITVVHTVGCSGTHEESMSEVSTHVYFPLRGGVNSTFWFWCPMKCSRGWSSRSRQHVRSVRVQIVSIVIPLPNAILNSLSTPWYFT